MLTFWIALALAQQPDPAQVVQLLTPQTGELARQWLHSPDARTEAWGAYLALRDRRLDLVPDLSALVESYSPGAAISLSAQDQHDAVMAVLDALIQLQAAVPAHDVVKIYSDFPVQALLLAPRAASQNEIDSFLMNLFQTETPNQDTWQAAGNMLVDAHAPGFGVLVFKSMTVRATVMVVGPEGRSRSRGGVLGDCPSGLPDSPKRGWPEIGRYDFPRFPLGARSPEAALLAPGIDPVYFLRTVDAMYTPTTRTCRLSSLPDLVREHYLATILNRPMNDPPLKHEFTTVIQWSGEDEYRRAIVTLIEREQKIFEDIALKLAPRGGMVVSERPKFIVEIWDQRTEKTPLPQIHGAAGVIFENTPTKRGP